MFEGNVWIVNGRTTSSLVGVVPDPPQVRITAGLAIGIEITGNLAVFLSELNESLIIGRAYWTGNKDARQGSVVIQDIVMGRGLSWDFFPSEEDLNMRINTLVAKANDTSDVVGRTFAGRAVCPSDAFQLLDLGRRASNL